MPHTPRSSIALPQRSFAAVRIYALITESSCREPWLDAASAALDGGASALQVREKHQNDNELLKRIELLRPICEQYDAWLILNDRPDLARNSSAHGVHVGQSDATVAAARAQLAPGQIVGVSTHTLDQVDRAILDRPNYIAVGPMFHSETKPQDHIAGPATLDAARSKTRIPLVAIGGIHASNVSRLQSADALAVCGAIFSSDTVADATRRLVNAFASK
jgi:thiamine-phosphate pyrophosphorylase